MQDALVTIVVASYNNANYIERCLESVKSQTYKNLEVIIVDDGSTDNTKITCQKFLTDGRVRFVEKQNGGLSSSRQLGLEQANGVFISFIDADDYLSASYVEAHVKNLIGSNADISVCGTRFESSDGLYLSFESQQFACGTNNKALILTADMLNSNTFPYNVTLSDSWNKMYKLEFLRKSGVRFELPKGFNGTDTAFNWKIALCSPSYSTIEDENYIHVIYKSSAVHRKKKNLYGGFQIITQQLIDLASTRYPEGKYHDAISYFYYRFLRMSLVDVARDSDSYIDCKRGIKELLKRHMQFINENNLCIGLSTQNSKDQEFRIILFILEKSPSLLPLVLYVRTRLAKFLKR